MTHDEAVAEAERLRREHPERHRLVFAPRERVDGDWEVVTGRPAGAELVPEERQAEMRAGPQVKPDPTESQTPRFTASAVSNPASRSGDGAQPCCLSSSDAAAIGPGREWP